MNVVLLVLHITCLVLYIINAIIEEKKSIKILWLIASLSWGICVVLDIIKIYII